MKISIVVAVYNAEATFERAIGSALKQNFPRKDFEIIAVNDGSTDNTLKLLKNYKKEIKIINQKNQGAVRAANAGFNKAKGEYLIKLDSDDYLEQDALKEMADILEKNPNVNFVYSDYYESFDGNKKTVSTKKDIFDTIACGIMFRKKDFAKAGFYNENVKFPEYDLLLKVKNKWRGYHLAKPLYHYERRKESLSGDENWVKEGIAELKILHPDLKRDIVKIRGYKIKE